MTKVLFVCLGNICRSPMAEGLMRQYSEEHQLGLIVDSAATSRWEVGNPVYPGTKQILQRENIDSSHMFSRQIKPEDFEMFDWIIGMDHENVEDLLAMAPKQARHKVHLYLEVVPGKENQKVPDPWYTGNFDQTYHLLQAGLPLWAEKFKTETKTD